MITAGKDELIAGKYAFSIWDADNKLVKRVGGFDSYQERDRAAEIAHREYLFNEMNFAEATLETSLTAAELSELADELSEFRPT